MAIGVVDELQAQDWDRYAAFIGPFLPGLLLGLAVLGFLVGQHIGTQVCVLLIALLLALIETPGLFCLCAGPCQRVRDRLFEAPLHLGKGWVKGLAYAVLSLACFLPKPSVAILAGILLLLAATVNACASLFGGDEPISMAASSSSSSMAGSKAAAVLPSYQPPAGAAGAGGKGGAQQPPKQPAVVAGFGTFNL